MGDANSPHFHGNLRFGSSSSHWPARSRPSDAENRCAGEHASIAIDDLLEGQLWRTQHPAAVAASGSRSSCARIALGSEATWRERRMAVLYDLLRFTDDERVTRICRLLAKDSEASRRPPMRRIRP